MANVGTKSRILLASDELQKHLVAVGKPFQIAKAKILFDTGDPNNGVFLLGNGRIRLQVAGMPKFDRSFSAGSLLGLPSTFTGHPYSLTAVCERDSQGVQVSREVFLDLMRQAPELCAEVNTMLCREVAFIHSALTQKRQQIAS